MSITCQHVAFSPEILMLSAIKHAAVMLNCTVIDKINKKFSPKKLGVVVFIKQQPLRLNLQLDP